MALPIVPVISSASSPLSSCFFFLPRFVAPPPPKPPNCICAETTAGFANDERTEKGGASGENEPAGSKAPARAGGASPPCADAAQISDDGGFRWGSVPNGTFDGRIACRKLAKKGSE